MNQSATVGYWARVNGLQWQEVWDIASDLLPDADGDVYHDFQQGWQDADQELTREKVEKLRERLADVDPDTFAGALHGEQPSESGEMACGLCNGTGFPGTTERNCPRCSEGGAE